MTWSDDFIHEIKRPSLKRELEGRAETKSWKRLEKKELALSLVA